MQTNNHKIEDYDVVLDAKFGKEGSVERMESGKTEPKVSTFYRITES